MPFIPANEQLQGLFNRQVEQAGSMFSGPLAAATQIQEETQAKQRALFSVLLKSMPQLAFVVQNYPDVLQSMFQQVGPTGPMPTQTGMQQTPQPGMGAAPTAPTPGVAPASGPSRGISQKSAGLQGILEAFQAAMQSQKGQGLLAELKPEDAIRVPKMVVDLVGEDNLKLMTPETKSKVMRLGLTAVLRPGTKEGDDALAKLTVLKPSKADADAQAVLQKTRETAAQWKAAQEYYTTDPDIVAHFTDPRTGKFNRDAAVSEAMKLPNIQMQGLALAKAQRDLWNAELDSKVKRVQMELDQARIKTEEARAKGLEGGEAIPNTVREKLVLLGNTVYMAKRALALGNKYGFPNGPLEGRWKDMIGDRDFAVFNAALADVTSAELKAISGGAVSPGEAERSKPFLPTALSRTGDTISGLNELIKSRREHAMLMLQAQELNPKANRAEILALRRFIEDLETSQADATSSGSDAMSILESMKGAGIITDSGGKIKFKTPGEK